MLTEERRKNIKETIVDYIIAQGKTCLTHRETCLSYMVGYCPDITLREASHIIEEILAELKEREFVA